MVEVDVVVDVVLFLVVVVVVVLVVVVVVLVVVVVVVDERVLTTKSYCGSTRTYSQSKFTMLTKLASYKFLIVESKIKNYLASFCYSQNSGTYDADRLVSTFQR